MPNPEFPFLGVHFTKMIDGSVYAEPNAVLSFKREGYRKTDINLLDLGETLTHPGFWKLVFEYGDEGLKEMWRSLSKARFSQSLQKTRSLHVINAPSPAATSSIEIGKEIVSRIEIPQEILQKRTF